MVRWSEARVCDIDNWDIMAGGEEGETVKAQVSITCVPCVLIILTVCPAERWVATPWLAGMSDGAIVMSSDF